jgi:hypothetical protein
MFSTPSARVTKPNCAQLLIETRPVDDLEEHVYVIHSIIGTFCFWLKRVQFFFQKQSFF